MKLSRPFCQDQAQDKDFIFLFLRQLKIGIKDYTTALELEL